MRKIEQKMIDAIRQNREWSEGNTTVAGGLVLLHGHVIARENAGKWEINLQGYNTQTTRSRLTAILGEFNSDAFAVSTKNGAVFVNYRYGGAKREINSEGWYRI